MSPEPCCCPCTDKESVVFQWNANGDLSLFPDGAPDVGAFDSGRSLQKSLRLKHMHMVQRRTTGFADGVVIVDLYMRVGGVNTQLASLTIPQDPPAAYWQEAGVSLSAKVPKGAILFVSFPQANNPGPPDAAANPDICVQVFAEEA